MEKGRGLICYLSLSLLLVVSAGCRSESSPTPPTALTPTREAVSEVVASATPTPHSPTATRTPIRVTQTSTSCPTPSRTATAEVEAESTSQVFLPWVPEYDKPTATATPRVAPSLTPTPSPTPYPTLDFPALRAELAASGQELAVSKLGFHVSVGGNQTGLGVWMRRLDEIGVPFFLKSVDYAGPIYEAQQLAQASGVPHVLVYRSTGDVPDYALSPAEAAREHWEYHRDRFPPELDRNLVWLETVNEVDKNRSEWLAQFALETAPISLAGGFRWAAFGWSGGEPAIKDWSGASKF